jgi:hypothetical protein
MTTPIISGFYPDPSVCRVGDTYWLACSSFEYAPGVPLFRSTDLVDWQQVGNVLARPSQLDVSTAPPSGGIFAPTLRHHDGRFWMITTNFFDGGGQVLTWATDPAGEWSDPVRLPDVLGIDPDLAWDDDGTCYLTYSGLDATGGPAGIVQQVIDPETGKVLTDRQQLWSGTGGKYPEGPHLYRIDEYWYLMIAEGGTERGHAVTIARGSSPSGPFEPCPDNPILTARGTDRPVQNTGHADLVQRPDGRWAIVYHGIRARGGTPEWHVLGRETFAADVEWVDGWPRLTAPIEPSVPPVVQIDELTGDTVPVSWITPSRFPAEILRRREEAWELAAAEDEPVFVGRRQQHLYAVVRATLDVTAGSGGLSIRIDPEHRVDIEVSGRRVRAVGRAGALTSVLGEAPAPDGGSVTLELRTETAAPRLGPGPDQIVAGLVVDGVFTELGRLDGRYVSSEVAGGFTGRIVGCFADRGTVRILKFVYIGSDEAAALS